MSKREPAPNVSKREPAPNVKINKKDPVPIDMFQKRPGPNCNCNTIFLVYSMKCNHMFLDYFHIYNICT